MSKKVKLFERESSLSRHEAAALLRRIEEHCEPIAIEIEATHKNDRTELEIEMTWTGGAPALQPPS